MTVAPDFFDTEPRNWRARLAVSVEVMRELSRYHRPAGDVRGLRAADGATVPRQPAPHDLAPRAARTRTTASRGSACGQTRSTRGRKPHRLPVHDGGLLAELLYGDQPRVIDELTLDPDDPAAEYLAGQRSLLAIPHFDHGIAQTW